MHALVERLGASFPRSPWECGLRRSASPFLHHKRTQSVPGSIPTRSVRTSLVAFRRALLF
jgi:hypothetical protein